MPPCENCTALGGRYPRQCRRDWHNCSPDEDITLGVERALTADKAKAVEMEVERQRRMRMERRHIEKGKTCLLVKFTVLGAPARPKLFA